MRQYDRYGSSNNRSNRRPMNYISVNYWIGTGSGCDKVTMPLRSEDHALEVMFELRSKGYSAQVVGSSM